VRPKREEAERPEPETLAHFMEKVKAFLLKNGLHMILIVGIVAVAVLGLRILSLRRTTRVLTQWDAVSSYPELTSILYGTQNVGTLREIAVKQCQAILETGQKTTATPWVMLKLGDLYTFGDEWAAAEEAYRRLISEYPQSQAAGWAKPALAVCTEQLGKYADAATAYEQLAEGGAAQHLYDAGRCRELSGDLTGAEADYRKLLTKEPAKELREETEGRLTALAQGRPLTAPPELKLPKPAPKPEAPELLTVPPETAVSPAPTAPQGEAPAVPVPEGAAPPAPVETK